MRNFIGLLDMVKERSFPHWVTLEDAKANAGEFPRYDIRIALDVIRWVNLNLECLFASYCPIHQKEQC